jgi:hypothetical protein
MRALASAPLALQMPAKCAAAAVVGINVSARLLRAVRCTLIYCQEAHCVC